METLQNEKLTLDRNDLKQALEGLGYLAETEPPQVTLKAHVAAPATDSVTEAINRLRATFGWDQHGRATQNTLRAIRIQVSALQRKLAAQDLYRGEAMADSTTIPARHSGNSRRNTRPGAWPSPAGWTTPPVRPWLSCPLIPSMRCSVRNWTP